MTKKTTIFFSVLLTLTLYALCANASYITLQNSMTVERVIYPGTSSINASLTNSGDEAANGVQLSLLLPPGFSANTVFLGRMDPNLPQTASFSLQIDASTTPGVYPFALLTEYKDANGYQFSSVTPNYLVIKEAHSSQVDATVSQEEIGNKGEIKKITVSLRNMDQKAHDVKIKIYAPKELKITPEEKTLTVKARDSPRTEFEISSFGALPGSSYVIFTSVDYDEGGIHYTSTASGLIKVVQQKEAFSFRNEWIAIILIIILVAAVIAFQFIGRPKQKNGVPEEDAKRNGKNDQRREQHFKQIK
ncbi:MAG: hypothetical protein WAX07_03995 [Candidatus Altiarchaeia archaeon]